MLIYFLKKIIIASLTQQINLQRNGWMLPTSFWSIHAVLPVTGVWHNHLTTPTTTMLPRRKCHYQSKPWQLYQIYSMLKPSCYASVTCRPMVLTIQHLDIASCLCWSLRHAEQLLFSCLCSKVSICNYVTCHISHVTCHMSYMSNAYVDPWDMLNNFCFHV